MKSSWELLINGVLQGLIVEPRLFNISSSDGGDGAEWILSRFAGVAKLRGGADAQMALPPFRGTSSFLEKQKNENFVEFIKGKCQVLTGEQKKALTLLSGAHWKGKRKWAWNETREIPLNLFTVRVPGCCRLPRELWSLHPWRQTGSAGHGPEEPALADLASSRGLGLNHLQSSLPTSPILWLLWASKDWFPKVPACLGPFPVLLVIHKHSLRCSFALVVAGTGVFK